MSEIVTVTDDLNREIREQVSNWIVSERRYNSNGRVHIDSGKETPEPICDHHKGHSTTFKRKDVAVYPPGYHDVCAYCATVYKNDGICD